jgi:radical SAM protein with 4Fe4S-binding SPASM domain
MAQPPSPIHFEDIPIDEARRIGRGPRMDPGDDFEYQPLSFLWLEITGRCNLQCVHCYAESSPFGTNGTMSAEDWRSVIRDASSLGTRTVQFIGGEPTIHPEFLELLRFAADLGFDIEVYTNLIHITPEMWEVFHTRPVSLATSFYSVYPNNHDNITTRSGSHERTLTHIKKALALYIPIRVSIIEIAPNQDVAATEQMLRSLGIDNIGIDKVRGVGRGAAGTPRARPVDALCGQCAMARATVDPEGWVYPCVFSRWLKIGNVRTERFNVIMKSETMQRNREQLAAEFLARSQSSYERICGPNLCRPQRPAHCPPTGIGCPPTGGCPPTAPCPPASGCPPLAGCPPNPPPCRPEPPCRPGN